MSDSIFNSILRKKITALIDNWENMKKSQSKKTKNAEKARKIFKKDGKKVLWIGKKNIRDILKKRNTDRDSFLSDMEFLKDQKKDRKMTLGGKDKEYAKRQKKVRTEEKGIWSL